jgi:uncharacterized protein
MTGPIGTSLHHPKEIAMTTQISTATAAAAFLAKKRIAVTGVSRNPQGHGGNVVYRRLRQRGYEVFPVNPSAATVDGEVCYPNLRSIPGGVDAVVIATRPDAADGTLRECVDLGTQHAWMHRSIGPGSVSVEAAAFGTDHGITVIAGGCPLMYDPAADAGHKVMRFVCSLAGTVPRRVASTDDGIPSPDRALAGPRGRASTEMS